MLQTPKQQAVSCFWDLAPPFDLRILQWVALHNSFFSVLAGQAAWCAPGEEWLISAAATMRSLLE
jgi:hypothetical protein